MAFKSLNQYQEDKNGEFFVLPNDKDFADVVFLYRSVNDVLVADTHYLNTATYKGYVHCCGKGCPACSYGEKGIQIQTKIFIPLYNITKGKIEFWDRTPYFESKLQTDVFKNFPNPSECVFRVTRHGEARSRETYYDIRVVGRNTFMPYEKILADFGITFPDAYSRVCIEMSQVEMSNALNASAAVSALDEYGYTPVPRGTTQIDPIPEINVPTPVYNEVPAEVPPIPEYVAPTAESQADTEMPEPISNVPEEGEDSLDDVKF